MNCIICGNEVSGQKAYHCVKKDMEVVFCRKHADEYCGKCEFSKCESKK
ncbi:MAG: hypothetical protein GTN39_00860 [Candidatus Aenigmarchaeota archaeon]|nr:hypothetical protein [Candidatus Aenigmarchaeota archaeon]